MLIMGNNEYAKLRRWRRERNITKSDYQTFCKNIIEELLEPLYDKEDIEIFQKQIVDTYFSPKSLFDFAKPDAIIDAIQDIRIFSINETELMGYNAERCIHEAIKEVSSREQDPSQKFDWEVNGAYGKWQKDKDQLPHTIYKANYEECKLWNSTSFLNSKGLKPLCFVKHITIR